MPNRVYVKNGKSQEESRRHVVVLVITIGVLFIVGLIVVAHNQKVAREEISEPGLYVLEAKEVVDVPELEDLLKMEVVAEKPVVATNKTVVTNNTFILSFEDFKLGK